MIKLTELEKRWLLELLYSERHSLLRCLNSEFDDDTIQHFKDVCFVYLNIINKLEGKDACIF